MSAFHISSYLDKISAKEKEQNSNIMVGAIDSFSEQNLKYSKRKMLLEMHRSIMFVENMLRWQALDLR